MTAAQQDAAADPAPASFRMIAVRDISESPTNPRKHFNQAAQDEMTDSVKKHGVLQPILVRPDPKDNTGRRFELIAGARRFRAATAAGLFNVPAMVRTMGDAEVLELQVVENLQREGLHELEEAEGYERLMKEFGYSIEDLMGKVNKSKAYIYARLKLCALNDACRKAFYAGKMSASVALLLARIPVGELQTKALKIIADENRWDGAMSYRAAADYIQRNFMLRLDAAPFPTGDADLVPGAGACKDCPKRSGNQPELFGDVKHADTCTDPVCHENKRIAFVERRRAEAEAKGQKVITGDAAKKIKPSKYDTLASGYITLNDPAYQLVEGKSASKPLRKLLGQDNAAVQLLEDPHTGEVVEVIKRSDALDALEQRGHKVRRPVPTKVDLKQKELDKVNAEFRQRLFGSIREQVPLQKLYDLRPVALAMLGRLFHDDRKRLVKLREWGTEAPADEIAKLDQEQLYYLLIDMALVNELPGSVFSAGKPEQMLSMADALKIDHAQMRREIQAEVKAKTKPAKKAAPVKAVKAKAAKEKKPAKTAPKRPETKVATEAEWPWPTQAESTPAAKPVKPVKRAPKAKAPADEAVAA